MTASEAQSPTDLLSVLWDIEQIKQLKARYFRFVDGRRWPELQQLFTEDCTFHSDGMAGVNSVDGVAAFVARVAHLVTPGISVHHGHMPEIAITGPDTASGVWAMFDYLELERAGRVVGLRGYGHYDEEYRKDPERGWLISRWQLTRLRVDKF